MANISLKRLFEAADPKLVARSKESGKLVYFNKPSHKAAALKAGTHEDPNAEKGPDPKLVARSKETGKLVYFNKPSHKTAAIKAGTHEDPNDKKGAQPKANVKPNDMFGGDYAKDRGGEKSKETRKGNPTVNKEAKKKAEEFGITPQKLGKDGYTKAMYQAAVEALTDANFHDEARELVSKIEGKPEWAKRVNYPSMDDPKYKEKMADIRTNGVDSSEYWGGEDGTHEFARKVAASSGWAGVDAADGIAFTLRMNGFHKQADMIQSVFDDKPYMREQSTKLTSMIKK